MSQMNDRRPPMPPTGGSQAGPDGAKKKVSRIDPYARQRGPGGGGPRGPGRGMFLNAKPKNAGKTLLRVFSYFKYFKFHLIAALFLVGLSSVLHLLSTYLLRPIIDNYIIPGDTAGLARQLIILAIVYVGAAFASLAQSKLLLVAGQKITNRIITEVPGVNRVLYDLTPKPTGTIEWE